MSRPSSISSAILSVTFASVLASSCGDMGPKPTPVVTISSIQPSSAPAGQATEVRIEGWNFKEGATVMIGDAATNVSVVSRTTIVATTSDLTEGAADVIVRNPDGARGKLVGAFTFTGSAPVTITSVSPNTVRAGDIVSVAGTGIRSGATVLIGGAPAALTRLVSGAVSARVPRLQGGPADVTITNPSGGTATKPAGITYMATSLTASATAIDPGGSVTISWQAGLHQNDWWDYVDWVGLFKPNGLGGATYVWTEYAWDASGSYTLTAPMTPGQYEFRYVSSGGTTQAVLPISVGSGAAIKAIKR